MTHVYMSKTGFIEDEAIFKFFKDIATRVVEEDIGSIDEGLDIIIHLLNKFPGIATRWSCTGHPEQSDTDDFHIITVVHDRGSFDILEDIVYQYNLKLSSMFHDGEGNNFDKHLNISKHGMLITDYNNQSLVYPIVSIESWFGHITEPSFLHLLRHEILTKLIQLNKDNLHDVLPGVYIRN